MDLKPLEYLANVLRMALLASILSIALGLASSARADELKPAYIELTQTTATQWNVFFKTSVPSRLARNGSLILPTNCATEGPLEPSFGASSKIITGQINCSGSILGQPIGIAGLEMAQTDALVRIQSLDHELITLRLTSRVPQQIIPIPSSEAVGIISNVAFTYGVIGVEHIVFGYDHLLFVIAIVLLLSGWQRIAWTVTAFTIAHSITLIGTTFGWFALPSRPVEAIIALSIVFLAVEIVKANPKEPRLSERAPWLVAFAFGLLHGFGFAGALAEIGLPPNDISLALFSFNLGVEIGQLAIVAVALMVLALVQHYWMKQLRPLKMSAAYGIGSIAMFWLIQRVI